MNAFSPGFADETQATRLAPPVGTPRATAPPDSTLAAPSPVAPRAAAPVAEPASRTAPFTEPGFAPGFVQTTQPPPAVLPDQPWAPAVIPSAPARGVSATGWVASGLAVLVLGTLVLSMAGFAVDQFARSQALGVLTLAAYGIGGGLLLWGIWMEVSAYRRLARVDALRALLGRPGVRLEAARCAARAWLSTISAALPDPAGTGAALERCASVEELAAILRNGALDPLRAQARRLGRDAAIQGGLLVAITPSPALDGLIAGLRSLRLVRQVASLYGLRPGPAVTLALLRRAAWTAATVIGLDLAARSVVEQFLNATPGIKHAAEALPGVGQTARRLYRLADVTAAACSPLPPQP